MNIFKTISFKRSFQTALQQINDMQFPIDG